MKQSKAFGGLVLLYRNCRDKLSIKWKLLGFLAAFIAVLLAMLWLLQTVFLESSYKLIQTEIVKSTSYSIAKNIDSADIGDQILNLYMQNRIYTRVVNSSGEDIYRLSGGENNTLEALIPVQLALIYAAAEKNGGTTLQVLSQEDLHSSIYKPFFNWQKQNNVETIIFGRLVTNANGEQWLILLCSQITPVNTTVDTLRVQLIFITAVMLVLSLVLAFVMAGIISRPIVKLNSSAKVLAKGDYDVRFEGTGYREISELSDSLNHAAGELGKVERMRRDFVANVSHDLRTPLTMITGYGEVMRDIPGENTAENVQIIIDEAKRLTALVNDILDLSKLQSGEYKPDMEPMSLTGLIGRTLDRYSKLLEHEGYTVRWEHDADVWIDGDELSMSQVIYNLFNNAVTYTGDDKTITVRQTVTAPDRVRIDVMDSGEGIPAEKLPYVWDRYYKADKNHKRGALGSGIGLSIVKNVLENHGGGYGVNSTEGRGSDFWFELNSIPAGEEEPDEGPSDSAGEARQAESGTESGEKPPEDRS